MSVNKDEFTEIFTSPPGTPETRPVMSMPTRVIATKKFISEVAAELGDDRAAEAADWIADKMERFGARTAQPVFDMDGNGPICSWCAMLWPLCGHQHLSYEIDGEDAA